MTVQSCSERVWNVTFIGAVTARGFVAREMVERAQLRKFTFLPCHLFRWGRFARPFLLPPFPLRFPHLCFRKPSSRNDQEEAKGGAIILNNCSTLSQFCQSSIRSVTTANFGFLFSLKLPLEDFHNSPLSWDLHERRKEKVADREIV